MPEVALPALLPALCFALHAAWRWRRLRLPAVHVPGRVTLILPLTGPVPGLGALLDCLAGQTLRPRRLVIAVESEADPALARARALAPACPFPVEIRIAGQVPWRGQKNTNLIAGLAAVDEEDEAVVLLDGDIRPQPWWLSAAASPAIAGTHDVVTGFRWQLLEGRGLVGHVVAWIDRMGAVLILPPRFGLVWGGTVGLSRRALAVLDLPRLLDRALVDDLTIGRAAKRAGLRFLPRGAITVPTPGEGPARVQLAFMRRQLQVVRICRAPFWCVLVGIAHLSVFGWLSALAALPDAGAALLLAGLSGCGAVRALCHSAIGARVGAPDPPGGRLLQALVGALPPLADGMIAALGWTMLRPRRLRWRHVVYEVDGPQAVRVVARLPHAA
ncbi:MAG TPA: hypothetical protein VE684_10540 [Crenalkalicoccus sp.]|nr:hypothetical protein [Crenalkalicoccus sp.]